MRDGLARRGAAVGNRLAGAGDHRGDEPGGQRRVRVKGQFQHALVVLYERSHHRKLPMP